MKRKQIIVISTLLSLSLLLVALVMLQKSQNINLKNEQPDQTKLQVKTTKDYILEAFSRKYNKPIDTFKIEVLTESGNFARGSVNFNNEHSGGVWFAVKQSGGWEIAFEGNGFMDCMIANKFNFPTKLVPNCLDSQNGNAFVQR